MHLKPHWVAVLVMAFLLFPAPAQAMSFLDFGRMNNEDESTYIALLIDGAAKILRAHGKPDEAGKTLALFKDTGPNSGVHQLADQMKRLNALNNRNATNPNNRAQVYQVEDAMAVALKDNGIVVPMKDLLTINQNFRPIGPPRSHLTGQ